MTRRACATALLALTVGLAPGCQAPHQERPEAVRAPETRPDTVRPRRRVRPTIDERWATTADEVPGFAGLFVHGDTLVVMLVEPARLAEAVRVLKRSEGFPERYRHVVARRARYNFRQLHDWKRRALELVGESGVVALGVDEARNSVYLGVLDSSYLDPIRAALIARGVPARAIFVEVTGPFRLR
jgi:hypothetical protein